MQAERPCINCGSPDTDSYQMELRGADHEDVALCEDCHEAINRHRSASS